MSLARAFWTVAPGRGEIREVETGEPGPDEVVVRTLYSGISRGTEALVFLGRVPPSEYRRMRAPFQDGDFPGPVKYGYISVGEVEAGPESLVGKRVFALYPHQTRYVVPASAVDVVPDGVPASRAILASNLETAINGVWDARPQIGDRVAVVGAGTIGCLVAWLAGRIIGCRVELVDINPARARVAETLGVSFALPDQAAPDADLVVHTSGSPAGLALALRLAAFEATIVDLSWYGAQMVPLALGEGFHVRRLTIRSSQVSAVPPAQRARWDTHRRRAFALSLLADPIVDVLVTGESAFENLPAVMARLAGAPGDELCHRIRYGE